MTAKQLVRPFNVESGRGLTNTKFKMDKFYRSVLMKQEDIWIPSMGPGNTATLKTLYEIGHTIMHADSICRHLRWDEEYHFLVPHMADFPVYRTNLDVDRIFSFSLPIAAMERETTALLDEFSRIHERLGCALFHGVNCLCPASIQWGAVYVPKPMY